MTDKKPICPRCRIAVNPKDPYFPFCSERCKMIDLGEWARERYVIKNKEVEDKKSEEPDEK